MDRPKPTGTLPKTASAGERCSWCGYAIGTAPHLGENDAFVHYLYYDQEDQLERVIRDLLELVHSRYGTDIRPAAVDLERDRAAISEQLSSRVDYLWRRKLADAQAFYREHGHLDIPYGYMVRGYNLGSWL